MRTSPSPEPADALLEAHRQSRLAWAEFAIRSQQFDDVIPCRATGIPSVMRSMEQGGSIAFIGRHGRPVAVLVSLDHYRDLLLALDEAEAEAKP